MNENCVQSPIGKSFLHGEILNLFWGQSSVAQWCSGYLTEGRFWVWNSCPTGVFVCRDCMFYPCLHMFPLCLAQTTWMWKPSDRCTAHARQPRDSLITGYTEQWQGATNYTIFQHDWSVWSTKQHSETGNDAKMSKLTCNKNKRYSWLVWWLVLKNH